ncbi:MAG: glycosyltransferase [Cytophagales bacterium]|nr:MAG: glycosyltransferase [Cytophagales bacterium]
MPLISIITGTLNDKHRLVATIASVQKQTGVSVEHIIVDGNGHDGTANWLRENNFPLVRWVSQTNRGISEAMNIGMSMASGEWYFFLCAGDELLPNILSQMAPMLTDGLDVLAGHVQKAEGGRFYSTFSEAMLVSNLIHHQAAFYHRRIFDEFQYDTSIKAMADYELNLLMWLQKRNVRIIDEDISYYDIQGISGPLWRSLVESNRIKFRRLGLVGGTRYGAILAWKYLIIHLKRIKRKHFTPTLPVAS